MTESFTRGLVGKPEIESVLKDWDAAVERIRDESFLEEVLTDIKNAPDKKPLDVVQQKLLEIAKPLNAARHKVQPDTPCIEPFLGKTFLKQLGIELGEVKKRLDKLHFLEKLSDLSYSVRNDALDLCEYIAGTKFQSREYTDAERRLGILGDSISFIWVNGADSWFHNLNDAANLISSNLGDATRGDIGREREQALGLDKNEQYTFSRKSWNPGMQPAQLCALIALESDGVIRKAKELAAKLPDVPWHEYVENCTRFCKEMHNAPVFKDDAEAASKTNKMLTLLSCVVERDEPDLSTKLVAQSCEDMLDAVHHLTANMKARIEAVEAAAVTLREDLAARFHEEESSGPRP